MSSYAVTVTETEATPLVGVVPAQDGKGPRAAASVEMKARTSAFLFSPAEKEELIRLARIAPPPPPAKQSLLSRLARLWRLHFVRFDPDSIPCDQPLSDEQVEMLDRHGQPGYFEQLEMDRKLAEDCLHHYNLKNPGNEYEPAPGQVYQSHHFHNGICWIHGNFVARKKCSVDCSCKTCYRRFEVPHLGIQKIFACGHKHVEKVCQMCYCRSHVLHPNPGEFAFGYHSPYRPYPTEH